MITYQLKDRSSPQSGLGHRQRHGPSGRSRLQLEPVESLKIVTVGYLSCLLKMDHVGHIIVLARISTSDLTIPNAIEPTRVRPLQGRSISRRPLS